MKPRRPSPPPVEEFEDDTVTALDDEADDATDAPTRPDLSALPVAGITRRRLGFLGGAIVSVWVVILFARQVGEATAATARVDDLRDANAALTQQLAALEREAELIQRQEWVVQQARGYRLGETGETPFSIADASPLPPDAPGSASVSLGASDTDPTPLESWLSLLFGPSR